MKKDIIDLKVEDLCLVVAPPANDENDEFWDVYLINLKDAPLESVVIASRGYGEDEEGYKRQTSTLRHFYEIIASCQVQKIETIPTELFWLSHEYWVSFSFDGHLFDKKYVFVAGSLEKTNFTQIPFLDRKGVMLR